MQKLLAFFSWWTMTKLVLALLITFIQMCMFVFLLSDKRKPNELTNMIYVGECRAFPAGNGTQVKATQIKMTVETCTELGKR